MEIFHGWEHYVERIEKNWKKLVSDEDTVVLAGDTSWGMSLDTALADFHFLEELPGTKILIKGNHDYWWNTAAKMSRFFSEQGLDSLRILHNNCFETEDFAVCGTRGWLYDGTGEKDQKVIARECGRLRTSLQAGMTTGKRLAVFLHYPPVYGDFVCEELLQVIRDFPVDTVYYGHIHGMGKNQAPNAYCELKLRLISCDSVDFTPIFIA